MADPTTPLPMPDFAAVLPAAPQKSTRRHHITFTDSPAPDYLAKKEPGMSGAERLSKSVMNLLNGGTDSIERMAFEVDPSQTGHQQGLWVQKLRGLPDMVLKRIAVQDHLVAAINNTRANHMSVFGRPRQDRHGFGYALVFKPGVEERLSPEKRAELQDELDKASTLLGTCGSTKGWGADAQMTFAQYLSISTKNAITMGRIATEAVPYFDVSTGKNRTHSFRPIDAGTIFRAAPIATHAENLRAQALADLQRLQRKKLEAEPEGTFDPERVAWIQVIEGQARQAFMDTECLVHNFYSTADIEFRGYPVTPIDTAIAAVTTHINITTHNKLYFQTGRAARGILVIKSDDIDDATLTDIRQQFNASVNSVANSWRVPVLGVAAQEDILWTPTDTGSRDMEFQYLSDMTARVVLSAFQMSPEELPGYAHLSRGTNNQALSESNQEYLLIAHRDVGLRPLVAQWQDFINRRLFPLICPHLVDIAEVQLLGLDAETAEKESIRIQQDAAVHMTMNDILSKVEKQELPAALGGNFLFNPQYQAILDKYVPVGQQLEHFFGVKGAAKDEQWNYVRDPFWQQQQQMLLQKQQMVQQAQQAQQGQPQQGGQDAQGQQPQGDPGQGQPPPGQDQGAPPEGSPEREQSQAAAQTTDDIAKSSEQAQGLLKSEKGLTAAQKKTLGRHLAAVDRFRKQWDADMPHAIAEIVAAASSE